MGNSIILANALRQHIQTKVEAAGVGEELRHGGPISLHGIGETLRGARDSAGKELEHYGQNIQKDLIDPIKNMISGKSQVPTDLSASAKKAWETVQDNAHHLVHNHGALAAAAVAATTAAGLALHHHLKKKKANKSAHTKTAHHKKTHASDQYVEEADIGSELKHYGQNIHDSFFGHEKGIGEKISDAAHGAGEAIKHGIGHAKEALEHVSPGAALAVGGAAAGLAGAAALRHHLRKKKGAKAAKTATKSASKKKPIKAKSPTKRKAHASEMYQEEAAGWGGSATTGQSVGSLHSQSTEIPAFQHYDPHTNTFINQHNIPHGVDKSIENVTKVGGGHAHAVPVGHHEIVPAVDPGNLHHLGEALGYAGAAGAAGAGLLMLHHHLKKKRAAAKHHSGGHHEHHSAPHHPATKTA